MTEKSIEARVLREMRLILTEVARETAPYRNSPRVLSEQTITRMRDCLSLISARERELNEAQGVTMTSRPKIGAEKGSSKKVQFIKPRSSDK